MGVIVTAEIVGLDAEIDRPAEELQSLGDRHVGRQESRKLRPVPLTDDGVVFGKDGIWKPVAPFDARGQREPSGEGDDTPQQDAVRDFKGLAVRSRRVSRAL